MDYIHAIILGIVQGVAEFLPISSSGHLVIADALITQYSSGTLPSEGTTMEVALHFGTLLSILVVYRNDLFKVIRDFQMLMFIVIATIPVGVIGILLKDQIEQIFSRPILAGVALLFTAGLLILARALQRKSVENSKLTMLTAVVIGVFQAIAIIPGISRSGSTIAAALMCGQSREEAARFSFLIAIPAIGGAVVVKMKDFFTGEAVAAADTAGPVAIGTLVAFVVGVVSLSWLIRLVLANRLHFFAVYCGLAGLATIVWQLSL